jgi:predicted nucleotidyltransferase
VTDVAARVRAERPEIEEIILIGSYATDNAHYYSDLDLVVILSHDDRTPINRIPEYLLLFQDSPLPTDVFVFTREEVERRSEASDPFILRALDQGVRIA